MKIVELSENITEDDIFANLRPLSFESPNVTMVVRKIISEIRQYGDEALLGYLREIEGLDFTTDDLKVTGDDIRSAYLEVEDEFVEAIKLAVKRIESFHEQQKKDSWFIEEEGITLGQLVRPMKRAGVYVPGGLASYPSSVLMGVIPAKVAGVKEIAICTPAGLEGRLNPMTLVAADICGVKEIYKAGGAQAIAALAYGTKTIGKVEKIVGPGNIYVTVAKKEISGQADIDMLAGPSEVVVIADDSANPAFIAADMLAQAEHATDASAILITNSSDIARRVQDEIDRQLQVILRREIAKESIRNRGIIFIVDSVEKAFRVSNYIAPEHLEIMVDRADSFIDLIENAGAVFVGDFSMEALGDYVAGPNHILPTMGTAKFYSALSVDSFIKKPSYVKVSKDGFAKLANAAMIIATAEGLEGHSRSVEVRVSE